MPLDITVADDLVAHYPDYRAEVVLADGLHNGPGRAAVRTFVADAVAAGRAEIGAGRPADHPRLRAWRETYASFGAKPSRYYCSAEALARRVQRADLPSINELVDIYNAISVKYLLPLGGEDASALRGTFWLRFATGDEHSDVTDGDGTPSPAAGEPIWVDDVGVTCRRWNWRQGRRTALHEDSTSVVFLVDAMGSAAHAVRDTATSELIDLLTSLYGADITRFPLPR